MLVLKTQPNILDSGLKDVRYILSLKKLKIIYMFIVYNICTVWCYINKKEELGPPVISLSFSESFIRGTRGLVLLLQLMSSESASVMLFFLLKNFYFCTSRLSQLFIVFKLQTPTTGHRGPATLSVNCLNVLSRLYWVVCV